MAEPRCVAGQKAPFDDITNYWMLTKLTPSCKASSVLSTQSGFIPLCRNAPINVMPERGGPRDRVGTLIRNENLESNFLTLGIRFQFKVPHLGEGFEFNISMVATAIGV